MQSSKGEDGKVWSGQMIPIFLLELIPIYLIAISFYYNILIFESNILILYSKLTSKMSKTLSGVVDNTTYAVWPKTTQQIDRKRNP